MQVCMCVCMQISVRLHTCRSPDMYVCMYAGRYISMYMCIYLFLCVRVCA